MKKRVTRRDKLYIAALRAQRLTADQASTAWFSMIGDIELLGQKDIPKFNDLYKAFRRATIHARRKLTMKQLNAAVEALETVDHSACPDCGCKHGCLCE